MTSDVIGGAKIGQDNSGKPAVALTVKDKDKFYQVTKSISEKGEGQNYIVIWLDFNETSDSYSNEGSQCGTEESNCFCR